MKKAQGIGKYLDRAHRADCLKLMQRLPDESVQMVFADPPFNLSKKYLVLQGQPALADLS